MLGRIIITDVGMRCPDIYRNAVHILTMKVLKLKKTFMVQTSCNYLFIDSFYCMICLSTTT